MPVLDRRAGRAQLLPVRQLADDARPAWRGWCAVAWREVARAAGCRRARRARPPGTAGMPDAGAAWRLRASTPARRLVLGARPGSRPGASARTPGALAATARRRCASGRSCRRRRSTSAPVSRTCRALSASIAIEVSAFFTAKVPPKPQHSSAPGSSTRSRPRTARSSRSGRSPTPQHPQRVAGRVVGHPVREVRADVGRRRARRRGTRRARRSAGRASATPAASAGSPARRATIACWWRTDADARPGRRDDRRRSPSKASTNVAHQRAPPRRGSRC